LDETQQPRWVLLLPRRGHIVVFEGGRIVQRGTYEELLDAEGLFRTLALRQLA
jgi:ABC-type transport system involved in cytochrome bd biosynthesis fused ATPase/permease subunit